MVKVGFFYDEVYLSHQNPSGHPESADRLRAIMRRLQASPLWPQLVHLPPRAATLAEIALAHERAYVEELQGLGPGFLDGDTFLSEDSFRAAQFAAGAVLAAVSACQEGRIERAFCAVRPPGHHAEAGRAMGFCLFNNVAIGARFAQGLGYKKVFIVDFDVHHGNGTQHIFEADDTVFYFSTHQFPHYPGTGSTREEGVGKGLGFTRNVPLTGHSGDVDYHRVYRQQLPPLLQGFAPDLVLVSAGYDIRAEDPLADMQVTGPGIRDIVQGILSASPVPVVVALEGGYHLGALAESVEITLDELLHFRPQSTSG